MLGTGIRSLTAVVSLLLLLGGAARGGEVYAPPAGGYLYQFEANTGEDQPGTVPTAYDALDGTFGYGNGSDSWDGSQIGTGKPGGVSLLEDSYVRLQDPGDPRDYGHADPSNRKIYLAHLTAADGATATILNDGATLHFRIRTPTTPPLDDAHPDGTPAPGIAPWPAGGDGYRNHDNGKGSISIRQGAGGIISFSLAFAGEHPEITESGLITNHLNGALVSADVDPGEAGTPNLLPLDPTEWHEFWITIQAGGTGTHVVTVYVDGDLDPAATVDVTASTGDDVGQGYLAFGLGSTGQAGAIDIDFCRLAAGVEAPQKAPPVPAAGAWGLLVLAAALLGSGAFLVSRRRTAPAA